MANNDVFLAKIKELKENGYSERDIAKFFSFTVAELRRRKSQRMRDNRRCYASTAKKLSEEGKQISEIAKIMELTESTIRLLLQD